MPFPAKRGFVPCSDVILRHSSAISALTSDFRLKTPLSTENTGKSRDRLNYPEKFGKILKRLFFKTI
jgi:hypothetical protein